MGKPIQQCPLSTKGKVNLRKYLLNPMVVVFGLVLLFAIVYASPSYAQTTTEDIPITDECPPIAAPRDGDGNGDGIGDWKLHNQTDAEGNIIELWCIDPNGVAGDGTPGNPYDEYYALVYVDKKTGERRFIGKCPYEGGDNSGSKTLVDGVVVNTTWRSVDGRGEDDDGDGKVDDAIYKYHPKENNSIVKQHSEDGIIIDERRQNPEASPFNYSDLPPRDPSDNDFWAMVVGIHPGVGERAGPERWTHAFVSITAIDEKTKKPLQGATITIENSEGLLVETLFTSDNGVASVALPVGSYVVKADGATQMLALEQPTLITLSVPAKKKAGYLLVIIAIAIIAVVIALALYKLRSARKS